MDLQLQKGRPSKPCGCRWSFCIHWWEENYPEQYEAGVSSYRQGNPPPKPPSATPPNSYLAFCAGYGAAKAKID